MDHSLSPLSHSRITFLWTFTFCWRSEGLLDLCEVEDHGQLVYLTGIGQVTGRHDRWDAQLLLQDAKSQLVVVNSAGFIQGGHVTVGGKLGLLYSVRYGDKSRF